MRHPSAALEPWEALTTGVPAALAEPAGAARVARGLAELVGCEAGTLGVSTLHLLFDWFGTEAATKGTILLWDESVYPMAKWGIERAVGRGARARSFAHFAPDSLQRELQRIAPSKLRPIVVSDGYCPGCGRAAPLAAYQLLVQRAGGTLLVDDTQMLGLFGPAPGRDAAGGGGSLRFAGLEGSGVVWVASLAKAFGAPLAALAGDRATLVRFEQQSETRMHASSPSAASIAAAARALALNRSVGDGLRERLAARVRRFRQGLARRGLSSGGGAHPVQRIEPLAGVSPGALHEALRRAGVRTVPVRSPCRGDAAVVFVITAQHAFEQIDQAVEALAASVGRLRTRSGAAPKGAEGARRCRVGMS